MEEAGGEGTNSEANLAAGRLRRGREGKKEGARDDPTRRPETGFVAWMNFGHKLSGYICTRRAGG